MATIELNLSDQWAPNVSGHDGKSTIDQVPGTSEQTIADVVELFEAAAKSAGQNVVRQTISDPSEN